MKIAIFTNGGYKGFCDRDFEERPIFVDAERANEYGGYHVKVSDLESMGVYSSKVGQVPTEPGGGGTDYNPEAGVLFFMDHEVEVQKFGKVKVRILSDGGYPFKLGHNRTFPVIVNGHRSDDQLHTVSICEKDAKAIGMYVRDFNPSFCLAGHSFGTDAEIL